VMVIAAFYSGDISVFYLTMGGVCLAGLAGLNILGFRRPLPYILVGLALWLMVELSGIHATLSGVLVAMTIPARTRCDTDTFLKNAGEVLDEFDCAGECGYSMYVNEDHQTAVNALEQMCHNVQPSLQKIETNLHPWVAFLILPIFGLTNAGFLLDTENIWQIVTDPVFLGIVLGLFLGKQLGIFLACWIAIKTGLAAMPRGSSFGQLYGGAVLCGIGFTMSLFIGQMAFAAPETLNVAKMGILTGSALSLIFGTIILYVATRKTETTAKD
jgi:Na+:H+ antiporter, NhaA family